MRQEFKTTKANPGAHSGAMWRVFLALAAGAAMFASAWDQGALIRSYPFKPEQLSSIEGISPACLGTTTEFKPLLELGQSDKKQLECARTLADRLPKLDPANRYYFGERYDPEKWFICMKEKITVSRDDRKAKFYNDNCDRYALLRTPNPEYWPYPEKGKPKFPEPPATPTWREGMTGEEYHKALCDKEAGEVIHRTVEDVERFYVIRPRNFETEAHENDRYVVEHPWGITMPGTLGSIRSHGVPGEQIWSNYLFTERGKVETFSTKAEKIFPESFFLPPPQGESVERYFAELRSQGPRPLKKEYDSKVLSRHGVYWRPIERPKDREHGIAGGEFFVIDLQTNEILAWQRQFMWVRKNRKDGYFWLTAHACRLPTKTTRAFVREVLKPKYKGTETVLTTPNSPRKDQK